MDRWSTGVEGPRLSTVLAGLSRFCAASGLGSPPLSRELVEAYCATGLADRASATRGTYRSVLRAAAEGIERHPAVPYPGAPAPAPYSHEERAALYSTARSQPRAWLGRSARVLLCFGVGAGLRPGELCRLVGPDVETVNGTVRVRATGREVVVGEAHAEEAAALCAAAGEGYLFHPGEVARSYKNFVNDLCAKLVRDPDVPALSAWRCRSSFICDHLRAGTPLVALAAEAGLSSVCSLRRHAAHVEGLPTTNAGLARRAAEEAAG